MRNVHFRAVCVAAGIAGLLAQSAPIRAEKAASGPPLRITFRALTDDGQQVTDLKPGEVQLKVNGKPRPLQSLSVYSSGAKEPAEGRAGLPSPYASNVMGASGRVIYLMIDDDSISAGREGPMKEAVNALISELSPDDQIGVLSTQGQLNIRPGGDPSAVKIAIDKLAGKGATNESDTDAQCRTTHVLAAIGTMLSVVGGRPSTIVVFSGGMSPPATKILQMGRRGRSGAADPSSTSDVCPVRPEDFENIGSLASVANADLYLFQLTEAMANRSAAQDQGFESLAGVTGGEFFRISAGPESAIARLLRETSSYYTATFATDPGDVPGQTLRIDLRATRDNVKLRSRPGIDLPKVNPKAPSTPKDMLRTAAEFHDLPLRASAYTSRSEGTEGVKIITMFEPIDGASLTAASVGLYDDKHTLKKQWTATPADLTKHPLMAAVEAPPGSYRVRVAAVDANGRTGTTDYHLDGELTRADPLKLSALVLGTQQPGSGFAPRMEFKDESVAIGLFQIYGVPKGAAVKVDLDVAQSLDGPAIASADTVVSNGPVEDMRSAYGGFSIENLKPGDYLMRAIVSLDGKPVGRVVRTLRKTGS